MTRTEEILIGKLDDIRRELSQIPYGVYLTDYHEFTVMNKLLDILAWTVHKLRERVQSEPDGLDEWSMKLRQKESAI